MSTTISNQGPILESTRARGLYTDSHEMALESGAISSVPREPESDALQKPEIASTKFEEAPDESLHDKLTIIFHFTNGTTGECKGSIEQLSKTSSYFAALMKFNEGKQHRVEITEIDYRGLTVLLRWAEFGSTTIKAKKGSVSVADVMRAYVVADRLMAARWLTTVMKKFSDLSARDSLSTRDLLYAQKLEIACSSTLMEHTLKKVAHTWCYGEEGELKSGRDKLILRGGELAWHLVKTFWYSHNQHSSAIPQPPDMFEERVHPRFAPQTGISRIKSLQKCSEPPGSELVQRRIHYTIRRVMQRPYSGCLSKDFKDLFLCGGPIAFEFLKVWVAACRCRIRRSTGGARTPYIYPEYWHICQWHDLTTNDCCSRWYVRYKCECLDSFKVDIRLGYPKVDWNGCATWVDE